MEERPRRGFAREARLLRGRDFRRVMRRGLRIDNPLYTLWAVPGPEPSAARLGLSASRRLGGAVIRNRAKRLLRETFRRQDRPWGFDVVLVPKKALLERKLSEVDDEWRRSLKRLASLRTRARHASPPAAG
ncbi:MAG TPA: ribonuclease P protein component [Vicinamibacteria bacterium]